jgi:hypothetical protein
MTPPHSQGEHDLPESNLPESVDVIELFRPVGQKELDLIAEAGFRAFPPRLFHQPIFYPVLNEEYAVQIARDWNTVDSVSGYVGYVTRFAVNASFLAEFDVETVGASIHQEYWIPAERLNEFNANIVGLIEVIQEFRGDMAPATAAAQPGVPATDGF